MLFFTKKMHNKEGYLLGVVLILFLIFNPFIALIISVFLPLTGKVQKLIFCLVFSLSFALLFSSREYGVEFYGMEATDDAANYISIFKSYPNRSFVDLLQYFIDNPSGGEIGYHLFYKTISLFFSNEYFIAWANCFVYFFIISFVFSHFTTSRHSLLLLGYFFVFPISLYNVAHIWRQQFAVLLFYLGVFCFYETTFKKSGKALIYTVFLVHLSSIFYTIIFLIFERYRRFWNISKWNILLLIISFVIFEKILFEGVITILGHLDLSKILFYAEGFSADKSQFFMLLPIYVAMALVLLWLEKGSTLFYFLLTYILICLTLPIAIPSLNSVYDRYINFSIPLIGALIARKAVLFRRKYVLIGIFLFILLVGYFRLGGELNNGIGVISFIGNGKVVDPFLGIIKLFGSLLVS